MASQLSSETKMDEKMDSSTSTEATGKAGRAIPPPLFSLENLYEVHNLGGDQNRHRSCTNTSLDSSSNCSLATTANTSTAPGTPYLVTPTGHHQQQQQNRQQHTIHRPRAVLPSSMSLDSGVAEVSPMYQLVRQFRYGESAVAGNGGGGGVELMNTSTGSGAAAAVPAVHNDGDDAAGLLINNGGNGQQHGNNHNITDFSFGGGALDDSIEGEDEELISIGHHFTPISAPPAAPAADLSQAAEVFRFPSVVPGATTAAAGNLATERRANRMGYGGNRHQHYSADNHHYYHRQAAEVNNNDPGFRNLNHNSAPAGGGPPAQDMMFDFDELGDEDDDDVFYNGGAPAEEEEDHSPPMRESRSWHIARPSCIIGGDAVDGFSCDNDEEEGAHAAGSRSAQLFSCSSSSRRSSSPIPIPSSRTNSTSSNCNFDSFFETSAAAGQQPMSSTFMSQASPSLLGSVPQPITRMPYYHQMAPPLLLPIAARKEEGEVAEVGGDSSRAFHQHHRRTAPFGTHFETSCSIITRSLVPSRFSPVPFHGRWYPNPQAVQRGHLLRQAVNNGLGQPPPTSYHLRFGRLPASPTYPLRAIPTDFRALTPTWEMDEPVEEEEAEKAGTAASAAASYELIFNFSQLSVNEISGEVMDIEVADGSGDDLHRHEDSEEGGGGDGVSPLQQSIFSKASTSSSTSSSSCSSFSSSPSSPSAPQLPDIVSSHRSASFRERSAVAAASKHLHRNTLPSFNAEHISSASVSGGSPHHHYHHHQAAEPRRTMSVSLPIEEHVISSVASQLRQISSDFSSSRQIIRSTGFNPLSSLSPVLDLIASAALLFGNGGRGSSSSTSSSSSASRIITRRQTFHGGNANTNGGTSSTSSRRVVSNSRFYTSSTISTSVAAPAAQPPPLPTPTPTTTGNSTFYVGTTTATSSAKTKSGK